MHNVGIEGMPRRYATYESLADLNEFMSIAAFLFGFAQYFCLQRYLFLQKW